MVKRSVASIENGMRIEKFVRRYLKEAPLSFIYRLFRKKDIKVNGHWVKKDFVLSEGDEVTIYITDAQLEEFQKEKPVAAKPLEYRIAYEDEYVLIVDKPQGLLVYGDSKEKRKTLAYEVLGYLCLKGEFDPNGAVFTPSPAHRLDRNTGGLVVFGKKDASLKQLEELFKERVGIEKTYLALVKGKLEGKGEIRAPLKKDSSTGLVKVTSIAEGGKDAYSEYHSLWSSDEASLVEVKLHTGRTHQIRVHLSHIGHPIVGDPKYGDFAFNRQIKASTGLDWQWLLAYSLSFGKLEGALKGLSGKIFKAEVPEKLKRVLTSLGCGEETYGN